MTFFEHLSDCGRGLLNSLYAIGIGRLSEFIFRNISSVDYGPIYQALGDAKLDPT